MSREQHKRPETGAVATRKHGKTTYVLYGNSELWTSGKHGFFCGYVSSPENIEVAIDRHLLEMSCLVADARREFEKELGS